MKKVIALVLAALLFTLCLAGCNKPADKTITVAASSAPHAEILEQVKDDLAAKGYTLVIKVMDDYVTPNTATEDGEVDANYFQHVPYLDSFNAENGTHLVSVAAIHYEPYAIYKGTVESLDAIPDGAKIAVPNDPSNEYRALSLLEAQGLLKLKDGVKLTATKDDIAENPKNLEIVELEASLLPSNLSEVAVAVINGNYAIANGLSIASALAVEDKNSTAAQTYANIICVKEGNEKSEKITALVNALKTDKVAQYIANSYNGAVVASF